jgi:hypothetical protein
MPTNLPPIDRYLDDKQWDGAKKAMQLAHARPNDGTRLRLDALVHVMENRLQWLDLDPRYGDHRAIVQQFRIWTKNNVLFEVVRALYKSGVGRDWHLNKYFEIKNGPSAVDGPCIRKTVASLVAHFAKIEQAASAPKRKGRPPKAAQPDVPAWVPPVDPQLEKRTAEAERKAAVAKKAAMAVGRAGIPDKAWAGIRGRIPDLVAERRAVEELHAVMCGNKPWSLMQAKGETWNALYSRFATWAKTSLMARLVKAMKDFGLTKLWSAFLVSPPIKDESRLKYIIGALAYGKPTTVRKPKADASREPTKRTSAAKRSRSGTARRAARPETARGTAKTAKIAAGASRTKKRATRATAKAKAPAIIAASRKGRNASAARR